MKIPFKKTICTIWLTGVLFSGLFFSIPQALASDDALFVAQRAIEDGFYDVALETLQRFLKEEPQSSLRNEAGLMVGQCYYYQNRLLDALAQFQNLLSNPNASVLKDALYFWLGEVYLKQHNFQDAERNYRRVLEGYPQSTYTVEAWYSLGWCHFQASDYPKALETFQGLIERFPKDPKVQDFSFMIIETLYQAHRWAELAKGAADFLEKYPQSKHKDEVQFYLAEAYYYLQDYTQSILYYQKVGSSRNEQLKEFARLGEAWGWLKSENYQEASKILAELDGHLTNKKEAVLLGKAMVKARLGQYPEALQLFEEFIKSFPEDPNCLEAYFGKGNCLYALGRYRQAIQAYQLVQLQFSEQLQTSPQLYQQLHYELAWSYLKVGDFKSAIAEFQKTTQGSEDKMVKISFLCQVADAYQENKEYQKAIQTYASILKDYPDSSYGDYAQYQLGMAQMKMGNYQEAAQAFALFSEKYPHSKLGDDASYALALSYFQEAKFAQAKSQVESLLTAFPDSELQAQACYLRGVCFYNMSLYTEASDIFREIIKSYPEDENLIQKSELEIADCLYRLGKEKEAIRAFRIFLYRYANSPLTPEALFWLGQYEYRKENWPGARRYFEVLIRDYPASGLAQDAYLKVGWSYYNEGKPEEAQKTFQCLLGSGSPKEPEAQFALAQVLQRQGHTDEARRLYEQLAGIQGEFQSLSYLKMAEMRKERQETTESIFLFEKAREVAATSTAKAQVQFQIAETYQEAGRLEEAIGAYQELAELYPEAPFWVAKAILRAASIKEDQQDWEGARGLYLRLIVLGVPESAFAKERLPLVEERIAQAGAKKKYTGK